MVKLLIIADDFTGALDTGIQFQKRGIQTQVFTKIKLENNEIKADTEVLVIDSESRPMNKNEAYSVVKDIVSWALLQGIEVIFKKTDSALRGNIGAELQAVVDAGGETVFFIPGHPKIRRITKGGTHYIDGELLENSVFGRDPFEPVTESYIPYIIKDQTDVQVRCAARGGTLLAGECEKREIVVCDTEIEEDIDHWLYELVENRKLKFIAGCAALGDCLVDKMEFHREEAKKFHQTDGLYVACGSLNRITQKQVEYADVNGDFKRIHLSMEQKLMPEYYETPEGRAFLEEIVEKCRTYKKVIVDTFDMEEEKEPFLKEHQIAEEEIRFRISEAHGRIVDEIVNRRLNMTILMTGGDTLMGYMKQIGCTQIEPVCEIEQGVVVSRIECRGYRQQVISKSGGFGTEDTLCRIAEKII